MKSLDVRLTLDVSIPNEAFFYTDPRQWVEGDLIVWLPVSFEMGSKSNINV